MSSSDSHDRSSRSSSPALSDDAITPRGGFMARPGLKSPPRHAVVVRVGDAPTTDNIPVARPSVPPPPPPSEPAPESPSEKITARAIPRPGTPAPTPVAEAESLEAEALARRERELKMTIPSTLPGELARAHAPESSPPPSDAPFVSNWRDHAAPASRRARSSLWPIVAAAAAGMVLGLATVATRTHGNRVVAPAAMATLEPAPVAATQPEPALAARATKPSATPSASASPVLKDHAPQPSRPPSASPGAKRSIF